MVGWLWWRDKGAAARPSAYKAGGAAWGGGSRRCNVCLLRAQAAVALPVQGAAVVMATRAGGAGASLPPPRGARAAPARLILYRYTDTRKGAALAPRLCHAERCASLCPEGCRAWSAAHAHARLSRDSSTSRQAGSSAVQQCRPLHLSAAAAQHPASAIAPTATALMLLAWPSDAGLRRSPRCGVVGGAAPTFTHPALPLASRVLPWRLQHRAKTARRHACVPNRLCAQCSLTAARPECRALRYLHPGAHLTASAVW